VAAVMACVPPTCHTLHFAGVASAGVGNVKAIVGLAPTAAVPLVKVKVKFVAFPVTALTAALVPQFALGTKLPATTSVPDRGELPKSVPVPVYPAPPENVFPPMS